jgi:hypothetical protein
MGQEALDLLSRVISDKIEELDITGNMCIIDCIFEKLSL